MARKALLGIKGVQKKGFFVTKREILTGYLAKSSAKRTPRNLARKVLADNISTVRWVGKILPRNLLAKAALKLLRDNRIKEIVLDAQAKKFAAGLTAVSVMFTHCEDVMQILQFLRKNHSFSSYNQTAENILKNPEIRNEFRKVLRVYTAFGVRKERPGHKEMIYKFIAGIKNPLIIDVGISEGISTAALAGFLRKKKLGARLIGIDILLQREAIERSKRYGFQFLERDISKSPVLSKQSQKADFVRASQVLRYITKDTQLLAIKNMLADLKIGGYLYIPPSLYRKVSASRVEQIRIETSIE